MSSIILTEEAIMKGKSDAGGWNAKQLKILGIFWPPPPKRAWITDCIGRRISEWKYQQFLALRGLTKAKLRHEIKREQAELPLPSPKPLPPDDPLIPPEFAEFKRWAREVFQRGELTMKQLCELQDSRFGKLVI